MRFSVYLDCHSDGTMIASEDEGQSLKPSYGDRRLRLCYTRQTTHSEMPTTWVAPIPYHERCGDNLDRT